MRNGAAHFTLFGVWLDGDPKQQRELDFELEVFAANNGLQIGAPARVQVRKGPGDYSVPLRNNPGLGQGGSVGVVVVTIEGCG